MKIKVQQVYDKGSRKLNEDDLLIQNNLFAVFDGAGSLVDFLNEKGETGGRIAARIAKTVFSNNTKPLKQLAIEANDRILRCMEEEDIDVNRKECLWSTAAAVVKLEGNRAEYFNVGDCVIIKIMKDSSYRLITPYFNHDLKVMLMWRKLADKKIENIYDELKDLTIEARREMNKTYACLNGSQGAVKFFKTGNIRLRNIRSLILFTDGLFIPKRNPEEPENWSLFVKLYQESGLDGILQHVRSLEKTDPNCWKYPRYKQHDDAAAIGIDFL